MKQRWAASFPIVVVPVLLSGIGIAVAQVNGATFFIDHAAFSAAGGFAYVEFYIQISYDGLHFVRRGDHYQAAYEMDLYVEDKDRNVVTTHSSSDTVTVADYHQSRASEEYRVRLVGFYLRPGDYRLRAILTDKESGQTAEVVHELPVRDFSGPNPTLSDIQFARNIVVDSSQKTFVKNNRRVDPNVPHLYGEFANRLYLYYELYNLTPPRAVPVPGDSSAPGSFESESSGADCFRTTFILRDENKQEVKRLQRRQRKPGTSCVQSIILPIDDLPSGPYTILLRVLDEESGLSAETSGQFTIAWHPLSFRDYTYEELLEQVHALATEEEWRELSSLPDTERQRGLLQFWQRRDPTPETALNEAMEEFYRRVRYADRHFKWYGGKGWKSPQGQTYITYGPPDEIHRGIGSLSSGASDRRFGPPWSPEEKDWSSWQTLGSVPFDKKPFAVWEYHQLNRRFVFVDERGIGVYVLTDPVRLKDW